MGLTPGSQVHFVPLTWSLDLSELERLNCVVLGYVYDVFVLRLRRYTQQGALWNADA